MKGGSLVTFGYRIDICIFKRSSIISWFSRNTVVLSGFPLDLFALERLGFAPLCNNVRHNSTSQLKTAWYSAVLPAMLPNSEPVARAFILAPNSSNKAHLSLFSVISATSHRSGIPAGLVIRLSLQFGSAPNSKHFRAVLTSSEINTR